MTFKKKYILVNGKCIDIACLILCDIKTVVICLDLCTQVNLLANSTQAKFALLTFSTNVEFLHVYGSDDYILICRNDNSRRFISLKKCGVNGKVHKK